MAKRTAAALDKVIRSVKSLVDHPSVSDRELLRRFAEDGDQPAFAALVRRYTGMVLGVCRRALPTVQDAEDACQATFLILARKAGAGRWRPSVANWLYTTARRVSSNARLAAERRARREGRAAVAAVASPVDHVTGRELLAALDEELGKLAARYREPLVLYYLEGLSRDEIAARLGVPAGTVKTQLERGRGRLGAALTRRGCGLGAGLLALAVTSPAVASPPRLVEAVLAAVSGPPPTAVAALAKEVSVNGIVHKSIPAVLALALVGVGLAAMKLPNGQDAAKATPAATAAGKAKPVADDGEHSVTYSGRVLGPDGRPVAGAKLYLTDAVGYLKRPAPSPVYGTTGPDGRFTFAVPGAKFADHWTVVAAAAANYGPGWVQVRGGGKRTGLTLQLVKDDVAIIGQVVDLQGRPVRAATVTVLQINAARGEDLGPWLEAARAKEGLAWDLEYQYLRRHTIALSPKVATDAEGRFRLTGIGRDRLVKVQLDGPAIASQQFDVLTRPGKAIELTHRKGDREYGRPDVLTTYYGADFRHVAAPGRPVVGVVRDRDTKKPLAGVTIQSDKLGRNPFHGVNIVQATTDAEGRYRLVGLPKGPGSKIMVIPDDGQPYLGAGKEVPDTPGLNPVTLDIELRRGIWIEGRLTDKATGQPRTGSVEYYAMSDNPHLRDYPDFTRPVIEMRCAVAKADGTFRVVGLPGPGLLGVYHHRAPYLRANERDDEFGTREESLRTAPWIISFPSNFNALAPINPAKGVDPAKRDVTIDQGWAFTCTVVGPDGKPVAGARRLDQNSERSWSREPMKTAEFAGWFNPRHPRAVLFFHLEKGLVGTADPPKGNRGTVTARMQAGATFAGRLVDAGGKPRGDVELGVEFRQKGEKVWREFLPEGVTTDRQGRFLAGPLLPGYEYRLLDNVSELACGEAPRAGAAKELGDVTMKPAGD